MKKLAKMGTIGFGLFAFSELFGIIGETQAFAALIVSDKFEPEDVYGWLDEVINQSEGYAKFKAKLIKRWVTPVVIALDK